MDYSVFIVNLKKSIRRRSYMQKLCLNFGISPVFINAVDGNELSDTYINKIYNPEKSIKCIGRELAKSEIGCALSHKKIYEIIIKKNIKIALIFEDDIIFNYDLFNIINKLHILPSNWELILLGHHSSESRNKQSLISLWNRKKIDTKYYLVRFCELVSGTYGYLINIKGAKKLNQYLKEIIKPIDHYTGDSNIINLYGINPPLVNINEYISKQENFMNDRTYLQMKFYKVKTKKKKNIKKFILNIFSPIYIFYKKIKPLKKYV